MSGSEFAFSSAKAGAVRITWQGRVVVTLRGDRASKFMADVDREPEQAQLLLARATGNFKRGNER